MNEFENMNAEQEAKNKSNVENNDASANTDIADVHHKSGHGHGSSAHRRHKHRSRFWRKLRKKKAVVLNVGIAILTVLVLTLILLLGSTLKQKNSLGEIAPTQSQGENSGAQESVRVVLTPFTKPVSLVKANAMLFYNRDRSLSLEEAIQYCTEGEERLDVGLPVTLSYELTENPDLLWVISASIEISEDEKFEDPRIITLQSGQRSVDVYHLKTNTTYFYRLNLTMSEQTKVFVQDTFTTANTPRILSIDGIANVRDIGGKKTTEGKSVRQGLLYRGTELEGAVEPSYVLTSEGAEDMRNVLGIKTDMDLRKSTENPSGVNALGNEVEHIYYGISAYTDVFVNPQEIRQVFADLADETKYPVYMHCTYGVDRTGTVCYLLEGLLGVDEEYLMREYELSALHLGKVSHDAMTQFVKTLNAMEGNTLQEKIEKFLLSTGVTEREIASIKSVFLEE